MEERAKRPSSSGRSVKKRRADWLTEQVWKRVLSLVMFYPQDIVLDIACEDGEFLRRIHRRNIGLAGICATPQLARTARYRLPEADIMYAELDDFPWLNQSFDVAVCLHSVSAMRDLSTTLAEVYRVLKPGGQFVLAAPWLPQPFRGLANRFLMDDTEESAPVYSRKDLLECFAHAGFSRSSWLQVAGLRCVVVCWKE